MDDIIRAVKFIESHEECQQQELWRDFVDYCLQIPALLADMMDCIGVCKLNPVVAVAAIPAKMKIPSIRQKLLRILRSYNFQVSIVVVIVV